MIQQYDIQWLRKNLEDGEPLKFLYFWSHIHRPGEIAGKFCFCQWFESPFIVDGVTYKTAEHWMMAQKALLFQDEIIFERIIDAHKPATAKELGRMVVGFEEVIWNRERYGIVVKGNVHKFSQYPELADYLLQTGNRILVEASPVDKVWGIGMAHDDKDIGNVEKWRGENLLGFALMEVRDILREA